jgi:hypothetical protein
LRRAWKLPRLRFVALAIALAVVVLAAFLQSGPLWLLGLVGVVVALANRIIGEAVTSGQAWWRSRKRCKFGRLVKPRDLRQKIDSASRMAGRDAQLDTRAVHLLQGRLQAALSDDGARGDPVTIVSGDADSPMGRVVEEASSAMGKRIQCFIPSTPRSFIDWLERGAHRRELPSKLHPRKTTLFLLANLDGYREAGLIPSRLDCWRGAAPRYLAVTTLLISRNSDQDPARRSSLNEWYGSASVVTVSGRAKEQQ